MTSSHGASGAVPGDPARPGGPVPALTPEQAPGWHLEQPRPGVLVWTTPSGRHYTVTAEPYPV
jgi:hypothetical protein